MRTLILFFLFLSLNISVVQLFAQKKTFVIVHGAWGGSWSFKKTADLLESAGNKVYRVNLTGLGERYHLADSSINLKTHINDVVNTILFEQLENIILMGHSYGGMVITGVADSLPSRIQKMIYLDAILPEDGESMTTYLEQAGATSMIEHIEDGHIVPTWVKDTQAFPRNVPHPLKTWTSAIRLHNNQRLSITSTYILTSEKNNGGIEKDMFYLFSQRANQYGWKVVYFEADHNPQHTKPEELVEILLQEQ